MHEAKIERTETGSQPADEGWWILNLADIGWEAVDSRSCLLRTAADWLGGLAVYIADIGVDFEVLDPPELAEQVRVLADRFGRASSVSAHARGQDPRHGDRTPAGG